MEEVDLLECTFDDSEVKRFIAALKFLYKISHTLLLEAFPDRLVLRSINGNQSAYARVEFGTEFFGSYFTRDSGGPSIQCGVPLKSCLAAFRTANALRSVSLALDEGLSALKFQLSCTQGISKTYSIPCMQDIEILSANFDIADMPCQILVDARAFQGLLSSFHPSTTEIVMVATPGRRQGIASHPRLQLHTYAEGLSTASNPSKKAEMQTEITVPDDDSIRKFVLNSSDRLDVTFSLKELKAVLAYCEGLQMHCALFLEGPGFPLVAKPFSDSIPGSVFYAELIMSTIEFSVLKHGGNSGVPAADDTSENERRQRAPSHAQERTQARGDSFTFSHQKEQTSGSDVRLPGRGHVPEVRARPLSRTNENGSQPSSDRRQSQPASGSLHATREDRMVEPRGAEFGHNTRGYEDQRWNLNEEGGVHDDGDGDDEYVGGTPERAIGDATQANAPF